MSNYILQPSRFAIFGGLKATCIFVSNIIQIFKDTNPGASNLLYTPLFNVFVLNFGSAGMIQLGVSVRLIKYVFRQLYCILHLTELQKKLCRLYLSIKSLCVTVLESSFNKPSVYKIPLTKHLL